MRGQAHIGGMADIFVTAFAAVIFANSITAFFIIGMWRIKRDEQDLPGYGMILFACFMVGAGGFALRESMQAETTSPSYSAHSSPLAPHSR